MESRCVARFLRVTPRKMRLVADMVRGKNVNEAIGLLKFTPNAGARPTLKAIQSAVANLVNSDAGRKVNADTLFVKTIYVDEGPSLRRFLPRAMGRATPIRKRMSHLTVLISTPPEVEAGSESVDTASTTAPAKAGRRTKSTAPAAKGTQKKKSKSG